jgi:putative SOS response-associated peptidase YedK
MCGRYALILSASRLAEVFTTDPADDVGPRYNIAPTQRAPIVRHGDTGDREIVHARWGLIPSWAKDPKIGARMINARSETVAEKPAFRSAVQRRRCLVPASGFFEWRKEPDGKQPYYIHAEVDSVFAFAGLWESWAESEGKILETYTILTTQPNDLVARIHNRMPVILPPEDHAEWLSPGRIPAERLGQMLRPHPVEGMAAHPVSRRVNSPANDDAACIQPLQSAGDDGILPPRTAH